MAKEPRRTPLPGSSRVKTTMVAVVALAATAMLVVIAPWTAPAPSAEASRIGARYARPGPFAAGVTTLDVNGTPVEVWYPADRPSAKGRKHDRYFLLDWAPPTIKALVRSELSPAYPTGAYRDVKASSKGPFPLVTFAHGFGGFRDQSTFLTTHLASWGFVVAAPDPPESTLAVALGQAAAPPGTDRDTLRAAVDEGRAALARTSSGAGRHRATRQDRRGGPLDGCAHLDPVRERQAGRDVHRPRRHHKVRPGRLRGPDRGGAARQAVDVHRCEQMAAHRLLGRPQAEAARARDTIDPRPCGFG